MDDETRIGAIRILKGLIGLAKDAMYCLSPDGYDYDDAMVVVDRMAQDIARVRTRIRDAGGSLRD